MGARNASIGLLVLAAGAAAWWALGQEEPERSTDPPVREPLPRPPEPRPSDPMREPNPPSDGHEPLAAEPGPGDELVPSSPLARALDEACASFLGEEPRVAELLRVVQDIAARAVVERESLQLGRNDAGELMFARGKLSAGDLHGSFLFEEGIYLIQLPGAVREAPWRQRDLQIRFGEDSGLATGCRAAVQFQPDEEAVASAHVAQGEERLVGWTLSVSPETGAEIRPMTVGASAHGWLIGSQRDSEARELAWVSGTAAFDAWLRVLQPHVGD